MSKFKIGEILHIETQSGLKKCMVTKVEMVYGPFFTEGVIKYRYGVFMDPDSVREALQAGRLPRDYSVTANMRTVYEEDLVRDVNDYVQKKITDLEARKAAVEAEIARLKVELKSTGR